MAFFRFSSKDLQDPSALAKAYNSSTQNRDINNNKPIALKTTASVDPEPQKGITTYSLSEIMQGSALQKPKIASYDAYNQVLSRSLSELLGDPKATPESVLGNQRALVPDDVLRAAAFQGSNIVGALTGIDGATGTAGTPTGNIPPTTGNIGGVIARADWGAEYDVGQRPGMTLPVTDIWIHHSVTVPTSDPSADMKQIEQIDIGKFGYPSYSWVIHPSGIILEGMGTHLGAHTYQRNSTSFGVCFIGNFENDQPTAAALEACVKLCKDLIAKGLVKPGVPTGGHRDVFQTLCPGANLYPRIPELKMRVAAPSPSSGGRVRVI